MLPFITQPLRTRAMKCCGTLVIVLVTGHGIASAPAGDDLRRLWNFESDQPGKTAQGFKTEVGTWEIVRDGGNNVLAQKARNDDHAFNVVLVDGSHFNDVDLSVRLKAVGGMLDQGGGVVWRAQDKNNYYVARYNPLEDNFRVYKVEKGKRTQFQSANVSGDKKWHTLRITMAGAKITCYLDGIQYLEVEDSTFRSAGKIGLWSKADAQSSFDDLSVSD